MIKIKSSDVFFTIEEVSKFLIVNSITVKRLIENGELRSFKVGKQYRIEKQDLEIYLASITTSPLIEDKTIEIK